jgi:hypothetical protein
MRFELLEVLCNALLLVVAIGASFILGFALTLTLQAHSLKPAPLILEKDEGERRVRRPLEGHPDQPSVFILKVDPHNGDSSHQARF